MRIAIVNGHFLGLRILQRIVSKISCHTIAWASNNGVEAVQKCFEDPPDLIVMDLELPDLNGVEATYHIMQNSPCGILLTTSDIADNGEMIFEALGYGALDVIATPNWHKDDLSELEVFLSKKIRTIEILLGKARASGKINIKHLYEIESGKKGYTPPLVVIGASTGGPMALAKILARFPKHHNLAVVIVQHLDQKFIRPFVDWLREQVSLPIEMANYGCHPTKGVIMIAETDQHLILNKNLELVYTHDPKHQIYCPSIDVFFTSVAKYWPKKSVAVLLTGMGSDGAKGLKHLHSAGWYTIAEHQKSCIVYGMPKAAIEMKATSIVLPLEEISEFILDRCKQRDDG